MKREHLVAARDAASVYPVGFAMQWSAAPDGSYSTNDSFRAENLVKQGRHVP